MNDPSGEIVMVADELAELAGADPEWPGGRRTAFHSRVVPIVPDPAVVALIPLVSHPVGDAELRMLSGVRVVANYGVGYDNIDVEAARRRGIVVTNTPDVLTEATADLTLALLLAAARRLREGLDLARGGSWTGWHPTQLLGLGLQGKSLGILGTGRIGDAVARRAAAFGMEIVYWDKSPVPSLEAEVGARRVGSLGDLLATADVVSVHLPLTPATRGLLGAAELQAMKPGSILINTARGAIVEQDALADALRSGPLAAAGLDVFDGEPEIPAGLRNLPNAFLLPHLGSATWDARRAMWALAAGNVGAVLSGRAPLTPVPAQASGG
jgi:glyoxylate reductase